MWFSLLPVKAQLIVTPGGDPTDLVNNVLLGSGVTAFNVSFTGGAQAYGTFTTGITPTNIGLTSGLLITCGDANIAIGPNTSTSDGVSLNMDGDSLLTAWGGQDTYDANILEFDFIPQGDTIKFRYVFGSEEYPEFVTNLMNDIFCFFISEGPDPITWDPMENTNIALIPNTNLAVSIHNVNDVIPSYPQYYVDNFGGTTIEYDGFTTVLTAWCLVKPCFPYHMRLAIADGGDHVYDSGVFLEAGSFSSGMIQTNISYTNPLISSLTAVEGCNDAIMTIKLPNIVQDSFAIPYSILGESTATFGIDYDSIPVNLIVPAGSDSVNLIIHAFLDNIPEGSETVGIVFPNSICLTETDTVIFTIIDYSPVYGAAAYNDTNIICGDTICMKATYGGGMEPYFFNWSNGAISDTTLVSPNITTLYYLTISDACGYQVLDSTLVSISGPYANAGNDTSICYGSAAQLTASGGTSYLWSNGGMTPSITVSPLVTTDYIVTVTAVCSDVDTVTVFVNPLPQVTAITSADSVCPGESAHLQAGGAVSYLWTSNPNDPSLTGQSSLEDPIVTPGNTVLYTVTGTDENTCVNTAAVSVVLKPVPTAGFSITDYSLCVNETAIFTFNGIAYPTATFNWNFDGGDIVNGSGMGPYEVGWYNPGYATISLQVDQAGCLSNVALDSVIVIPRPSANFEVDITSGCSPLQVNFSDYTTSVMPGSVYEWFFGNGDKTLLQNPGYTYNNSGTFNVTLVVSNLYGCNDTLVKTALIHVYPNPEASFSYHPQRVSIQDPVVKFYDNSFGYIKYWLWDFGDESTAATANSIHTYNDTGTYQIVFTVYTEYGCVDSAFGLVVVTPDNTLYIPDAFTPNHDGHNDVFQAFGTNIPEFQMDIYNRWGELIFTSDNINTGWDGYYKGDIAQTGVYNVIIKYRDINGNKHSHYGRVTLIR
ncbi:MAG: choice-of-anchor L domain-containing protein [Bacteroidales bacterium]